MIIENARTYATEDAAVVLSESDGVEETSAEEMRRMLADPRRRLRFFKHGSEAEARRFAAPTPAPTGDPMVIVARQAAAAEVMYATYAAHDPLLRRRPQ